MGYIPDKILNDRYLEYRYPTFLSSVIKKGFDAINIDLEEPLASISALLVCIVATVFTVHNITDYRRSLVYAIFSLNSFGSFMMHSSFINYAILMDSLTMSILLIPLTFTLLALVTMSPIMTLMTVLMVIVSNLMMFRIRSFEGLPVDAVDINLISNISMILFLVFYSTLTIGVNDPGLYAEEAFYILIYGLGTLGVFLLALLCQIISRVSGTKVSKFQKSIAILYPHFWWHVLVGVSVFMLVETTVIPTADMLTKHGVSVIVTLPGLFAGFPDLWLAEIFTLTTLATLLASTILATIVFMISMTEVLIKD